MAEKINFSGEIWRAMQIDIAEKILQYSLSENNLTKYEHIGNTLYHYCSLPTFLSIIQTQKFFSTDFKYLNDKSEFEHGVGQVLNVINEIGEDPTYKTILENVKENLNSFYNTNRYVTCFSKAGDILSQWRAYANNGKGVAIGFDIYALEDFFEKHIKFSPILYDDNLQKENIKEIILTIINYFEGCKIRFNWDEYGYERMIRKTIISFLGHIISSYKSELFSEEKEFRAEYHIDGNINKDDDSETSFRATDAMIIPYKVLKAGTFWDSDAEEKSKQLPIREIIIGPSVDFELTKQSIEILLNKLNYKNVQIKSSEIPYRI